MKYFTVTRTNIPYELAQSRYKLIQLEKDSELGDIFNGFMLCSTGNTAIIKDGESFDYDRYFKSGMYVNLFPIKYIEEIESDKGNLQIKGFTVCKEEKVFHPLKGFDKHGNEIADLDKSKETIRCRYFYTRMK